ncbi:unnamed protein product [Closterium sp. NIES-54]
MALRPSSVPLRVPLLAPRESSLPEVPNPESDRARAASPTVSRLLPTAVSDPSFESAAASALVAELLDFAAVFRLDYANALVADSASANPSSVGSECALGTDVLEDTQEEFECLAAAVPCFASMLPAPEGDPDVPDIPTPRSYAEAITGPYSSKWQSAMDAEMASWKSTGTYVDEGVDYFQTFSPTLKMTTLRVLLHVAAQRDYELHSLDFSTAFLHSSLHEEIWLCRPPGFTESFPAGTQWNLRRPVYGLRQAPRKWHDTLRTTLGALGFAPATADPSLFLRTDTSLPPIYILVYVDDLVFATADTEALTLVKSELQKRHTYTDLGELCSYLGLQITRDRAPRTITLTQSHMVHQPSGPYRELVGCLMYLMTCTRPDLAYPLSLLARYMAPGNKGKVHLDAAKTVQRYLWSTSSMGLVLGGRGLVVLTSHSDAFWVEDSATQRSSQGYTFSLGSGSVSWRSTCSSSVLSSSCEAEIYAGAMAAQELRWFTYLLTGLGEQPRSPPVLYVDNKAMFALCEEHRLEHRTKHIALRYFLARELQQRGQLRLAYVATRTNTADVFTKALAPGDHQRLVTVLGLFTRFPFSSSEATAKAPLDEVVMDVVGPLKLGAAGAEYFLTIVDVYTRMTWVYVLSKKSDVAETVKTDWLPMVERQQDRLRTGQSRRRRASFLVEAGLPNYFWPDGVRSACVPKNRALTHVGAENWVPYVEWIGRKPKVDMLRVFGCMCMALVPKHLRHNKLGAKAIWAVHLGMAQKSKGWLLWDPFSKKFLVSRDCKFMENLMYKDWKAENEAKIDMWFGEVKSSGLDHVELPLELSSGSTNTRQSSLVNGGEEAKDAEEEEEEVQQVSERALTLPSCTMSAPRIRVTPQQCQGLQVPASEEEGRGKGRIQAPNWLTYEALGKPAMSALAGAALMVGDDEESDYKECAFAFFSSVEMPRDPETLKEALESSDAEEWKKAMESELKSIEENDTWELVELPEGRKASTSKWLFKIKSDANGNIERYKSRLVAKGYQQKEKDKIFMAQPEGFDDGSGRVWNLKKVLYGLKQAPREWYLKLREVLEEIGFTPSSAVHSLFMLSEGEQRNFMVAYVDDILIFSPSSEFVKEVMLKLQDKFKCKALGSEEESVGEEERRRFHSLVGRPMYAAVNIQPDVAFATGQQARVVQCPNEEQAAVGMRVAKYLGQTATVGLQYSAAAQRRQKRANGVEPGRLFLTAFSDASYAEQEDMTSVGGFICCVGGGPTAWESKKQVDQALIMVDSEYMAYFRAVWEMVWQRRLLAELGEEKQGPTPIYCDSKGAIALAKNPVLHGLTKHMRVNWHWTRSTVAAGEVELHYVKTTRQPADMMTKRLVQKQHWKCCKLAGMALN